MVFAARITPGFPVSCLSPSCTRCIACTVRPAITVTLSWEAALDLARLNRGCATTLVLWGAVPLVVALGAVAAVAAVELMELTAF